MVTLQTLPGDAGPLEGDAGKVGGFSLHAGIAAQAHESQKLERLCRYIARPAISERRLSISPQGRVRYQLKMPWRNGTTHVEFEPIGFIAKLAALVPPPRAHLTPSGRGKRLPSNATQDAPPEPADHRTPDERRRSMSSATAPCVALPPTSMSAWAQRLKRVFNIDVLEHAHYRPGRAGHRPRPRNRKIGHAHQTSKTGIRPDAATTTQGRARPAVGNQCEMATNGTAEHTLTRRKAPL